MTDAPFLLFLLWRVFLVVSIPLITFGFFLFYVLFALLYVRVMVAQHRSNV